MCGPVGLLQLKVNLREVARGARDLEDGEVTLRPQLQLGGRLPLLAAGSWLHSLAVQLVLTWGKERGDNSQLQITKLS